MNARTLLLSFVLACAAPLAAAQSGHTSRRLLTRPEPVRIQWTSHLPGDFSFHKKWDYPSGIERLPNGRPGCADGGFCPPQAQAMQDAHGGRIPDDSLAAFYRLINTTHRHYTLQAMARTYEYAGAHYLLARRTDTGAVVCATEPDAATHCRLILLREGDSRLGWRGCNAGRPYPAKAIIPQPPAMNYTLEDLSNMNTEQLQAVIDADAAGDGELLFELEGELKAIVHEQAFPGSETFGDPDEETGPERCVRVLIEALDFATTLSAINALNDSADDADL